MIKAGIVGGTGYTGVELLRLLVAHPGVELSIITSRSEAGQSVAELFPNLRRHIDLSFQMPQLDDLRKCDVVFFATPNGTAMSMVPELLDAGVKVIDLAADFRLKSPTEWQQWYGIEHACPEVLEEAVYGMPEINREQISKARIIANPGCYPTAVTLGFLPLIEQGLIDDQHLIADAKSGVSGAGRGTNVGSLLCEASENFKPYGVDGHRHLPEIKQTLGQLSGHKVGLTFVPHLVPMIRGIEASLYAVLKSDQVDLHELYTRRYQSEPFVDVLPVGSLPETRSVKGSNMCRISVFRPQQGDTVVISSVIDNLVKGAAGQAVHNMNIMFRLDEAMGISHVGLLP
ncbi:MAG: N-acetyl-gamma-glutamyl-phosphate reductase [Gammaproteobacteria bacterium]|nr:N-acetyl-gamma-glutamyl-phosphate reductase [Gammaproteobacteria bacterium]MCW9004071.1 N-acetyl-gamma-glutamyl-phosphate reductase [Gammaproteobacteria bacterium]MCW9056627.1 N-acetyl-gamma-glutamyl-phosphate reductase [Gammaproteobacteria bacterium]